MATVYTDEQIASVVSAAREAASGFTTVQNTSFVSTPIINGMRAGKTADEISDDIWKTLDGLSQYPDQYGLVGSGAVNGNNMLNVQQIVSGAVHQAMAKISPSEEEEHEPAEPEYVYTKVTEMVGTENPKTEGWYEEDGNGGYQSTNDESITENKDYYTRAEKTE